MRPAIILFCISILIASCTSNSDNSEKKHLTASIWPQKYFLEKIAGDEYEINVMIPASNSPAVYEPSPQQINSLNRSVFYFAIGELGFEKAWLEKLQANNPKMLVVNTSEGIKLIHDHVHEGEHQHGTDPHYWMSPGACFQMAINMKTALVKVHPENAELYEKNLSDLEKELSAIDFQIRDMLAEIENRNFLIYHPSLSYYARDYNLKQIPVEMEGKEPSLMSIKETIQMANELGLKDVFIQRQFNAESATTIARELDGKVILFDPLSYNWDEEILSLTKMMLETLTTHHEEETH